MPNNIAAAQLTSYQTDFFNKVNEGDGILTVSTKPPHQANIPQQLRGRSEYKNQYASKGHSEKVAGKRLAAYSNDVS